MADNEKIAAAEEVAAKEAASKKDKAAKKEAKKKAKSDKPGLWAKIRKFFKDLKSEFKKVVWYGRKQTIKSTALVIVCLVVVSAVVSLIDIGLSSVIMWLGGLINL